MNITQQFLTKKMLVLAFLATASVSFPKLSNQAVSDCYEKQLEGQWKYVEFQFIFKPTKQLESVTKHIQAGAVATAAGLVLARNPINRKVFGSTTDLIIEVPTAIATGALCVTGYYAYYCYLANNIKKATLVNFLKNWSFHRAHVPTEIQTTFDELAKDFQAASAGGAKFSQEQVDEIFEIIQHLLEHTFEKRYVVTKKAFDPLGAFKTITEIGKNLKP